VEGARARLAVLIPIGVLLTAAVVAIAVGLLLHQVPKAIHTGGIEIPIAPLVALILVLIVMGAGWVADSRAPQPATPRR
jgi:hypothetical protein